MRLFEQTQQQLLQQPAAAAAAVVLLHVHETHSCLDGLVTASQIPPQAAAAAAVGDGEPAWDHVVAKTVGAFPGH